MNKNIKIEIAVGVILAISLLLGGFFWLQNREINSNAVPIKMEAVNNPEVSEKIQIDEEYPSDENLVWYNIPELNIKFKVSKEIADNIGYEDNYVERGKSGYRLYAKNYPKYPEITQSQVDANLNSFAFIIAYDFNGAEPVDCSGGPQINLLKTDKRVVCYIDASFAREFNNKNGIDKKFDSATTELFKGYLKNILVEEIK